jgi:DNA repair protein RadC
MPERKTRATKFLRLVKTELVPRVSEPGPAIREPLVAGKELSALIGSKDREHFVVFHLDTRHRVQSFEIAAIGSLSAAIVHPREVFKGAILANASAIICGHNHPSGDPTPSEDDREMHRRLQQVGELIGIEVLDLLIVAGTRCWSARLEGETW